VELSECFGWTWDVLLGISAEEKEERFDEVAVKNEALRIGQEGKESCVMDRFAGFGAWKRGKGTRLSVRIGWRSKWSEEVGKNKLKTKEDSWVVLVLWKAWR
jgi:hypothetical protein